MPISAGRSSCARPTPPANSADGTVIYKGTGSAFADLGLANGTTYYYAVFAYDLAGHESAAATASASPLGGVLNAPTYVPAAGTYNLPLSATISSANTGDIICYTTNGSTPACDATPTCTTGALASGSVTVAASQTLKAISCKTGSPVSAVAPAAYTIDMTAPVFSGLLPANGASVSSAQLSYSLSETCVTGSVTWTRTGGSADAGSPHTSALTMSELLAGSQSAITLVNTPPLVQGAIYDIGFSCSDAAGNNSPPAALSAFRAIAGDGRITLVWNNPGDLDLAGVKILRKTGGFSANNSDGTVVFNTLATSILDTPLVNGTQYYYRVFAYDNTGNASGISTATATPFIPCGGASCRIFVTAAQLNGNLGGIAGADAKCNIDAAKPNASNYRAILSDGINRVACSTADCAGATGVEQSIDWPLFPGRSYVRADGTTAIGMTGSVALLPASLTNPTATGGGQVWTGLNADWTSSSNSCGGWLDSDSGSSGMRGTQNSATAAAWSNGINSCNAPRSIYCVEQ